MGYSFGSDIISVNFSQGVVITQSSQPSVVVKTSEEITPLESIHDALKFGITTIRNARLESRRSFPKLFN